MVVAPESVWELFEDAFVQEYEHAVVYADFDRETVLHEGEVRVLANGWVKLPTGRLLSPESVHHIDA